jgi:hypothetical protein
LLVTAGAMQRHPGHPHQLPLLPPQLLVLLLARLPARPRQQLLPLSSRATQRVAMAA